MQKTSYETPPPLQIFFGPTTFRANDLSEPATFQTNDLSDQRPDPLRPSSNSVDELESTQSLRFGWENLLFYIILRINHVQENWFLNYGAKSRMAPV